MRYSLGLPESVGQRYWLVDTASLPENEVLRRFYEAVERPEFRWLYEGTAHDALKVAGPVLLDVTEAMDFQAVQQDAWCDLAAVVIDAPLAIDELQQHLAGFMTVDLPSGGEGLLRFHEPMALHLLLGEGLLGRGNHDAMLGAGTRWFWPICRCQSGWLYEAAAASQDEVVDARLPLLLEAEVIDHLSGTQQLSRLMPVLADVLDRYGRHEEDDTISALWRDIEQYGRGLAKRRQSAREGAEALAAAQREALTLSEFRDWMNSSASAF